MAEKGKPDDRLTAGTEIGAGGFTLGELHENITRDASTTLGSVCICRRCGKTWTVQSWNFHGLCNACFSAFDTQKMVGRWAFIGVMPPSQDPYYESSTEWIKANPHHE